MKRLCFASHVTRDPLRHCQRQLKLPHPLLRNTHPILIQPSLLISPGRNLHQLHLKTRVPHVVIIGELIPVKHGELYLERALIVGYVEKELLIPNWDEGVSDDTGVKDFLLKEMTTNGSMSQLVRVTIKGIQGQRKKE